MLKTLPRQRKYYSHSHAKTPRPPRPSDTVGHENTGRRGALADNADPWQKVLPYFPRIYTPTAYRLPTASRA
jgi:hypothetical protein